LGSAQPIWAIPLSIRVRSLAAGHAPKISPDVGVVAHNGRGQRIGLNDTIEFIRYPVAPTCAVRGFGLLRLILLRLTWV
ncbi:MAG: hypothetical protein ABH871_10265, partial [Pseudomonadota bacterium]